MCFSEARAPHTLSTMLGRRHAPWVRGAFAWALYDFAYSIFSFLLLVRYFPDWVINDLDRPDWYVAVTQVAVVGVIVLTVPIAGALGDQLGRRKPLLVGFTLLAAVAAAVLGVLPSHGNVLPLLVAAGVAAAAGQLALSQYDPLLADVAPEGSRGRVSGLAVAMGFTGTIFALAIVAELVVGDSSKQRAFIPAALLLVVFALPAFVYIHEHERAGSGSGTGEALRRAWRQVRSSVEHLREYPSMFRFLVGRFLYSDAIATVGAFLAVYMSRLGGFSERGKNLVLGLIVVTAAVAAVAVGRLLERHGPRRLLVIVLPVMAGAILFAALIGRPWTIWALSPIAGATLGVVWTTDRVFMLRLTPLELRGQYFGFFSLANRVASAIGPLIIWSGTVWLFHDVTGWLTKLGASRLALCGLAVTAFLGWLVIRRVSDEPAAASTT
jgi:UMF1 family MFS transporter